MIRNLEHFIDQNLVGYLLGVKHTLACLTQDVITPCNTINVAGPICRDLGISQAKFLEALAAIGYNPKYWQVDAEEGLTIQETTLKALAKVWPQSPKPALTHNYDGY